MLITSRGQLVDLINNYELETERIESKDDTKMFRTILHRKKDENDRFYRIHWGEVKDLSNVYHLWFDEELEEVFTSEWIDGWYSKSELKAINNSQNKGWEAIKIETSLMLEKASKRIRINKDISGIIFDRVETVEGATGSGKTEYALIKTARAIVNNDTVLYFSTEDKKESIIARLHEILSQDDSVDVNAILANSNVKIVEGVELDDKYILSKMASGKPDLVIVDVLQMVSSSDGLNNSLKILDIHRKLDKAAMELGCEVLVTTKLNENQSI